jgi:hypothetical protein
MEQARFTFISYMLRLWLENDQTHGQLVRHQSVWRASLEDPHTQEMQVFADLEALFDFLLSETKRLAAGEEARLGEADDVS